MAAGRQGRAAPIDSHFNNVQGFRARLVCDHPFAKSFGLCRLWPRLIDVSRDDRRRPEGRDTMSRLLLLWHYPRMVMSIESGDTSYFRPRASFASLMDKESGGCPLGLGGGSGDGDAEPV